MFEYDLRTARKLGTYQAIADMMRDQIRKLAESEDVYDTDWAIRSLVSLADRLDEAKENFKKEVDTAVT